jgi:hypothetical protein
MRSGNGPVLGRWSAAGGLLCLLAGTAAASVGPEAAAHLGGSLTPLGGERAGNAEGSIPAWDGGLTPQRRPAQWQPGGRYVDPYSGDKPLLVIGKDNLDRYAARLSPGQLALFERYPDSYRLAVYPSRRSYAAPAAFYAGTRQNATQAYLDDNGETAGGTPQKAVAGIPFPIPGNGAEALWNQRLRWRGPGRERAFVQISVSPDGAASLVRFAERTRYDTLDAPPRNKKVGQVLAYTASAVLEPAKLAGTLKLVWDTLTGTPRGWQRSPGQMFISSTSEAGGDTPALGANGLLHEDQEEGYAGSPARYEWRLLPNKRELYLPYNSYRLHDAGFSYTDLLGPHHLNPDVARYELHRVWVVQARCRPAQPCVWPRRTLYLDEDSWQVLLAEAYGPDDRLAVLQEEHTLMAYDQPVLLPALEAVYDLIGGRYLANGMNNQSPEVAYGAAEPDAFDSGEMNRWARKLGAVPQRE